MIKRLLYLGYYLKKLNRGLYVKFLKYAAQFSKKSKILLSLESLYCVFKYNISLLEYFQFGFYLKTHEEKIKWAGTGYMYEYQLLMNPELCFILVGDFKACCANKII